MADVFDKQKRSQVMAAIRSRGNRATELKLISIFRAYRVTGWRRNQKVLGRPDFIFPRQRLAIFVDGCFWHGCRRHCRMPKSRGEYWRPKIERNKGRDAEVTRALRKRGWRIFRIWEHRLKDPAPVVRSIKALLESGAQHRYNCLP